MFRVLSVVAIDSRVYPGHGGRKRIALVLAAGLALASGLAACGGGGGQGPESLLVSGRGFTFRAPSGWDTKVTARGTTAQRDEQTLVSVTVLPLVKPYRPALFPRVVAELDRVAGSLAKRLQGSVASRRSTVVAGRRVRSYELAHDDLVDRLTFVLRGRDEFLLTCRWRAADGEPAACALLASSFRLR